MKLSKRLNRKKLQRFRAPIIIAAFAIIGGLFIFTSHAATPTANLDPTASNSTVTNPAKEISVTSASGGKAVQFKQSVTGGQNLNCAPSPHLCGFADETNTGILAGVTLTKVPSQATSGSGWSCNGSNCSGITITGNVGSATTGLELADGIEVNITGSNLVAKNLKLLGVHGQSADAITVAGSTNNVTIDHCDLTGAPDNSGPVSTARGWSGVHILSGASNFAVNYCNIHGFSGPLFPTATKGTVKFIGNYLHHIVRWDNNATDHCNNLGNSSGPSDLTSSMLIKDNTMWGDNNGCMSSVISMFPDFGPQTNQHTLIEHNLISSSGYYCINPGYGNTYGSSGRSYIAMKDNHWSTKLGANCGVADSFAWGQISYVYPLNASSGAGNYQCGNIWDDGPMAGSGADQSNEYPSSKQPVTTCPSPLPW